jgi:hypothetical protein
VLNSDYIESLITFAYGNRKLYYKNWDNYSYFKRLVSDGYVDEKEDKPSFKGMWAMHLYYSGKLD